MKPCMLCAQPACLGRRLCLDHLHALRTRAREKRDRRIAQGLCAILGCPHPGLPKTHLCIAHHTVNKERCLQWRKEHGAAHRGRMWERRLILRELGLCYCRGTPPLVPGKKLCEDCTARCSANAKRWYDKHKKKKGAVHGDARADRQGPGGTPQPPQENAG